MTKKFLEFTQIFGIDWQKMKSILKDYIYWNKIANKVSDNFLIIKRYGYLYFKDGIGEGIKIKNEMEKDKKIRIYTFFIF